MSPSRPISAPGSTAAASSTGPSGPTRSARKRSSRRSAGRWRRMGQHIELGIAESNLFLLLAALGLAGPLFGARLLPIGTVYDPFIKRGLDALNYALYQDCALHPGGDPVGHHAGAGGRRAPIGDRAADRHRPARADRVRAGLCRRAGRTAALGAWRRSSARTAVRSISGCRPGRSSSPSGRSTPALAEAIVAGGYWLREPAPDAELAIAYCGAVAAGGDGRARGDPRRPAGRRAAGGHLARAAAPRLAGGIGDRPGRHRRAPAGAAAPRRGARDRRPTATRRRCRGSARWRGNVVAPLGVDRFGQSGDIPDLYRDVRARSRRDHRRRGAGLPADRCAAGVS